MDTYEHLYNDLLELQFNAEEDSYLPSIEPEFLTEKELHALIGDYL